MTLRPRLLVSLSALLLASGAQAAPSPWFGVWKLKVDDASQKPETLIYSDAHNGAMQMVSVEDKSLIVTRFDGEPSVDLGATSNHDWTLAIKATSATSYTWTYTKDGKPRAQGANSLAADLMTFKEVSWIFGKPETTKTFIYERR